MGLEFHLTEMGHRFYKQDVPAIVSALERIATAMEKIAQQQEEAEGKKQLTRRDIQRIMSCAMAENMKNQKGEKKQ